MTQTDISDRSGLATIMPERTAAPPALRTRVIVNRLPGTSGWRPGMAPTLEFIVEEIPNERSDK